MAVASGAMGGRRSSRRAAARGARALGWLLALALWGGGTGELWGQAGEGGELSRPGGAEAPADLPVGPFRVRGLRYLGLSGRGMRRERLDWEAVRLTEERGHLTAPRPGETPRWVVLGELAGPAGAGTLLDLSAIREIPAAITRAFQRRGYAAVRVEIRRRALEALLEPGSDGILEVEVHEGIVERVDASVRRIDRRGALEAEEEAATGPRIERLLRGSPVQPGGVVRLDRLDDYCAAWSRSPLRRVEAILEPGDGEDAVRLRYRLDEVRPWRAHARVANGGTPETGRWREQVGFSHGDLTGHDDALSMVFLTAEFDEANAGSASYEWPLAEAPRLALRIDAGYSEYQASEVGAFDLDFEGSTFTSGAEVTGNFYQRGALFLDMTLGARYHRVRTQNETFFQRGEASFLVLSLGLRGEERRRERTLAVGVALDESLPGVDGTSGRDVVELGRTAASDDWRRVRFELFASSFLEPWLAPRAADSAEAAGAPALAHELAATLRGQLQLRRRTAPNFTWLNGGARTVRGYPEAFASGDSGLAASLEYRLHVPRLFSPGPPATLFGAEFRWRPERAGAPADWDWLAKVFVDYGRTSQEDQLSFERELSLLSAGLGTELMLPGRSSIVLDYGVALRAVDNGTDDVSAGHQRLHFAWTVMF